MEEQGMKAIAEFDALFTTNQIQMLKILHPNLGPRLQGGLAIYIKLMELQHAYTFFQRSKSGQLLEGGKLLSSDFFHGDNTDTLKLLDEMLLFSGPAERAKIEDIRNMLQNFKKMNEMMDMMKMMKELFPDGMSGGGNPLDMLSGMTGMSGMPDLSGMPDMSGLAGMDLGSLFQMMGKTK